MKARNVRDIYMTPKTQKIINQLARQVVHLSQPIQVLAICSGGKIVGKQINKFLKNKKIKSSYFEVWTNIIDGKATIWKTDFKKKDYIGTILLAEDVIWSGRSVNAAKRMLQEIKKKKVYTAGILDCNHKADFAVFR